MRTLLLNHFTGWLALSLLAALGLPDVSHAQQDDPAPEVAAPGRAPRATDATVDALLQAEPTQPGEIVRVISILIDLRAADRAAPLVQRLIEANLDEAGRASLVEDLGSAVFIKLSLAAQLGEEGRQFAADALAAADRQSRDPERIAGLIARLGDPRTRQAAISRLRTGRETSVVALVAVLADPQRAAEHEAAREALVGQRSQSIEPLLAVIQTSGPQLRWQAVDVLGRLDEPALALWLLAPALSEQSEPPVRDAGATALERLLGRVPAVGDAAAALSRRATSYRRMERPLTLNADGAVTVWYWHEDGSRLEPQELSPRAASLEYAARLAGGALELAPGDLGLRRLVVGTRLEAEAYRAGLGQPLPRGPGTAHELAVRWGSQRVHGLLAHALSEGNSVTAAAAAGILAETGSAELLDAGGSRPAPLVQAVRHPDRRLRFAALEAIVRMQPARPYPGSSHVIDALAFFAGSFGSPKAIVADARPAELQLPSGLLDELGYQVDATTTPREVLALAGSSPDYELVLIDMTLAGPTSGQLIQQLRSDNRTARLPVGILASSEQLQQARLLAGDYALVQALVRPQTVAGLEHQVASLLDQLGAAAIGTAQRQQQAASALAWLSELSTAPPGMYNLQRAESAVTLALWTVEHSAGASAVLAVMGTPASQKALVDLASQALHPLEARQAAARAFAQSVARYGTLLTTGEIRLQYDRYNLSETQDRQTQLVLASILDAVEARAAAEKTE